VIADAHGYPETIQGALEHGGFRPGEDAFVYAGDFLDRGPDPEGCLELVERHATEVLVGNHELAVLLGLPISGFERESRGFRQLLLDRVLGTDSDSASDKAWKVATSVEGVLITHAGVHVRYQEVLDGECQGDPARLAAHLNRVFVAAVRQELETGEWDKHGILGETGPLCFRPLPYWDRTPLAGVTQVVGHTPPQPELEADGFYMIDPCAWMMMLDGPGRLRYAVIEEGRVEVRDHQGA
jgi:hypothetical protein